MIAPFLLAMTVDLEQLLSIYRGRSKVGSKVMTVALGG